MIQQIHALRLEGNDETLSQHLSKDVIEALIERHASWFEALYACADLPEDRARMMTEYADNVFAWRSGCGKAEGSAQFVPYTDETSGTRFGGEDTAWRKKRRTL